MITKPSGFQKIIEEIRSMEIENLEINDELPTMVDYTEIESVPHGFPRPKEHFVVMDFLIDLPAVSMDFSSSEGSHGRAYGYNSGEFWLIAESIDQLKERLIDEEGSAFYGI